MPLPDMRLADVFLTAAPEPERFAALPDLEARLAALCATAEAAWPTLAHDGLRFVRRIGELLPATGAAEALLAGVRAADLYLAAACASGSAAAIRAFEERYLRVAAAALTRFKDDLDFRSEALQELRVRLFDPSRPRIEDYDGSGSLEAWVKLVAVRVGLNLLDKNARHVPVPEVPEASLGDAPDAELDILKTRYRADFTAALSAAFAALPADARRILRFYLLDRLNIGEIGLLVGASRATIGRRVVECRRQLLESTRAELRRRLGAVSGADLDSVVRLVGSRFDLTLSRVLGAPAGEPDGPGGS